MLEFSRQIALCLTSYARFCKTCHLEQESKYNKKQITTTHVSIKKKKRTHDKFCMIQILEQVDILQDM